MIAKQELKKQREPEKLHERYGKIGISAVVAALTYQGDAGVERSLLRLRPRRLLRASTRSFIDAFRRPW